MRYKLEPLQRETHNSRSGSRHLPTRTVSVQSDRRRKEPEAAPKAKAQALNPEHNQAQTQVPKFSLGRNPVQCKQPRERVWEFSFFGILNNRSGSGSAILTRRPGHQCGHQKLDGICHVCVVNPCPRILHGASTPNEKRSEGVFDIIITTVMCQVCKNFRIGLHILGVEPADRQEGGRERERERGSETGTERTNHALIAASH